uniref:THAP-type domain-containing protein n=1 Tax=Scylla olivacea TaxID=85551 RepID=A0A0P4VTH8_SCYOL
MGRSAHCSKCCICGKKKSTHPGTKLHLFPKDPRRRMQWLRALNITHKNESQAVCTDHFDSKWHASKGRLLNNAVPNSVGGCDQQDADTYQDWQEDIDAPKMGNTEVISEVLPFSHRYDASFGEINSTQDIAESFIRIPSPMEGTMYDITRGRGYSNMDHQEPHTTSSSVPASSLKENFLPCEDLGADNHGNDPEDTEYSSDDDFAFWQKMKRRAKQRNKKSLRKKLFHKYSSDQNNSRNSPMNGQRYMDQQSSSTKEGNETSDKVSSVVKGSENEDDWITDDEVDDEDSKDDIILKDSKDRDDRRDSKDGKKKDDKKDRERREKKEKKKMITIDPYLLLSFVYFDQTHTGYIIDRDLEDIINMLGLNLSRAQQKKLMSKVMSRDVLHYRKLTDISAEDKDKPRDPPPSIDLEFLAMGNNTIMPLFVDAATTPSCEGKMGTRKGARSKEEPIVSFTGVVKYGGSLVDISKLMQQLEKSDNTRSNTEEKLKELQKELLNNKEESKKASEKISKLTKELKMANSTIKTLEEELQKAIEDNNVYQRALNQIKLVIRPLVAGVDLEEDDLTLRDVKETRVKVEHMENGTFE